MVQMEETPQASAIPRESGYGGQVPQTHYQISQIRLGSHVDSQLFVFLLRALITDKARKITLRFIISQVTFCPSCVLPVCVCECVNV